MLHEVLKLPDKEKLLTISMLWNWWTERNRGNHGEQRQSLEQFQYNAKRCVHEWTLYLKKGKQTGNVQEVKRWIPPQVGYVKINTDASIDERKKGGGWGSNL